MTVRGAAVAVTTVCSTSGARSAASRAADRRCRGLSWCRRGDTSVAAVDLRFRGLWVCRHTTVFGESGVSADGRSSSTANTVSIRARGVPTGTVSPSATSSSVTRPVTGAGTSVSTLSVAISRTGVNAVTVSPTLHNHCRTVASVTVSPNCGIVIRDPVTSELISPQSRRSARPTEERSPPTNPPRAVGCTAW